VSVSAPQRILVRAPTWVGDVVMCTPVLRALRAAHPRAHIAVETRPVTACLLEGLASVDEILPDPGRGLRALAERARALRARRFDWAVLLPDSAHAALGPFLARIPVRAGYAREPLRRLLLTRALDVPRDGAGQRTPISMIERYLRITRALGCADAGRELQVRVSDAARERLAARLRQAGIAAGARFAVVTPGAAFGASKLWPPEHFAAACDRLARELELPALLAPGPGEEGIARAIAARAQSAPLLFVDPPLRLDELAALIERAALLLTNDTGPRHLAVALGRPQVVLMGPTDPRHTDHWLELQRVLREPVECSPCHLKTCPIDHRCMVRLAPERVVAAAAELLA
jgi:heptosyltransferase-2